MADQKIRLGIIGLGAQGGYYAGFLTAGKVGNTVLGAICDTDEAKRAVADGYGVPFHTDYVAMLDSGQVDAVVTTVPHYLHPQMAVDALERGIHVLVEKPAGVYTGQVRRLLDIRGVYGLTRPLPVEFLTSPECSLPDPEISS